PVRVVLLSFGFLFSSRRRHTRSVSAFLLNRFPISHLSFSVQPDIEAERKKRDEIEAGKSYCSRRFGGATCDDKSAQIYARFDKRSEEGRVGNESRPRGTKYRMTRRGVGRYTTHERD